MAGVNFSSFTQANSPSLTQFIVGYDTAVSGGERRFALTDIKTLIGGGTVTTVSVVTANGVSGSVANPTTTPAITLTLGAITPSSVSTGALTSSALTSGRVPFATTAGLLTDSSALTFNSGTGVLSATSFSGSGASLTGIVTSLAGTANQITASASTGAVTLSLAGPFNFTSLTNTALLLGAGTSAITPADLTYVSPTLSVPDGFVVSSAGSISLTAGGSNKNITLTPSGSGFNRFGPSTLPTPAALITNQFSTRVAIDAAATDPILWGRRTDTSFASPSAVQNNEALVVVRGSGYATTAYSGVSGSFSLIANENWTDTTNGSTFVINTTAVGTAASANANTLFVTGAASAKITGGAGNMTITAGTGASRTLTLQTTTSGSAATTALTLGADQSALFAGVTAFAGAAISATSGAVFPVGTTALSSLRIPHGAAPASPVNGDMWTTTAGLFVRINGATVGPLS